MASITDVAAQFFDSCEKGKGWAGCSQYCLPNATFSAQAEPLAEISTLEAYAEWVKGLLSFMSGDSYDLKTFATDNDRRSVAAYAVFTATHTGDGGPCPPTGKTFSTDYVYIMYFDGDKISHMTKVWHSGLALEQLGWT